MTRGDVRGGWQRACPLLSASEFNAIPFSIPALFFLLPSFLLSVDIESSIFVWDLEIVCPHFDRWRCHSSLHWSFRSLLLFVTHYYYYLFRASLGLPTYFSPKNPSTSLLLLSPNLFVPAFFLFPPWCCTLSLDDAADILLVSLPLPRFFLTVSFRLETTRSGALKGKCTMIAYRKCFLLFIYFWSVPGAWGSPAVKCYGVERGGQLFGDCLQFSFSSVIYNLACRPFLWVKPSSCMQLKDRFRVMLPFNAFYFSMFFRFAV